MASKFNNFAGIFFGLSFTLAGVSGVCYQARDLGVKCDGRTDDTEALNRAIASMKEKDRIYLPTNAVCIISDNIRINGKKDFRLIGASAGNPEISARRPENSAVIIENSEDIMLAHFKINSPNTRGVGFSMESSGIGVKSSRGVYLESMTITNQMSMGVWFEGTIRGSVRLAKISEIRHHGVHIQGASEDISVRSNEIWNMGRDGLSVIDWGSSKKSVDIRFVDNTIRMTNYSGIRVGTAQTVMVMDNRIYQTLLSGIMIQVGAAGTGNVVVQSNLIEDSPRVRERQNEWDTGIRVSANGQDHEFVNINKNTIRNPKARPPAGSWAPHGMQVATANGASIQQLYIIDNIIVDNSREITQCNNNIEQQQRILKARIMRNKLNDAECSELFRD